MNKLKKIFKSKPVTVGGFLVLQIVVGAASGAVAGWLVSSSLLPQVRVDGFGSTSTNGLFATTTKNIMGVEADVVSSSIRLVPISSVETTPRVVPNTVLDRQSPVAIIYTKKQTGAYLEKDELARAIAMTADGWFVAPAAALTQVRSGELVIIFEQEIYQIERMVNDDVSGVIFIKTNADHLPVASFAQYYGQKIGMALWLESQSRQFTASSLIAARSTIYPEARLSDKAYRRMLAEGWIDEVEAGAPIWDANGSLVGIVESGEDGVVELIPAPIISSSLQSLVSNGEIKHASLGVYTTNLSLVIHDDVSQDLPARGAIVSEALSAKVPSIVKGSVAEKAGLKVGDVILQVDRDIIDESSDLGDIILQFHPGADVDIRVWRDGSEMEIPITLGEQVTSKVLP